MSNKVPTGVVLYGKIFDSIFGSSVMEEQIETRYLWHCLIVMADRDGNVDMTPEALARTVNLPLDVVRQSLERLNSPDPKSRSPEHEGRRIVKLDEHRDWGWHLVNHEKYREIRTPFDRRAYMREYMRHKRASERKGGHPSKTAVKPRKRQLAVLAPADSGVSSDSSLSVSLSSASGNNASRDRAERDRRRARLAELEWRTEEAWAEHLRWRARFFQSQNGHAPSPPALTRALRKIIRTALESHDGDRLAAEDRERWKAESPVRAAGKGIFLSAWHTGRDKRNDVTQDGRRFLEPERAWKPLKGVDPVPTFAELFFEERRK